MFSFLGIIISLIEYPRGAKSISTSEKPPVRYSRNYQHLLSKQFAKLGLFYSNYFNRFIIYLM